MPALSACQLSLSPSRSTRRYALLAAQPGRDEELGRHRYQGSPRRAQRVPAGRSPATITYAKIRRRFAASQLTGERRWRRLYSPCHRCPAPAQQELACVIASAFARPRYHYDFSPVITTTDGRANSQMIKRLFLRCAQVRGHDHGMSTGLAAILWHGPSMTTRTIFAARAARRLRRHHRATAGAAS